MGTLWGVSLFSGAGIGDLGFRVGVMKAFRLRTQPSPAKLMKISEPWRPYRSYASRMLWHYYHAAPPV